jgi:hypothetical protein
MQENENIFSCSFHKGKELCLFGIQVQTIIVSRFRLATGRNPDLKFNKKIGPTSS